MEEIYQQKLGKARRNYYSKEISKLKKSDPRKWYYWLKRLIPGEECKRNEVNIEVLNQLTKEEQAEIIANEMSKVRNEYEQTGYSSCRCEDCGKPFKTFEDKQVHNH